MKNQGCNVRLPLLTKIPGNRTKNLFEQFKNLFIEKKEVRMPLHKILSPTNSSIETNFPSPRKERQVSVPLKLGQHPFLLKVSKMRINKRQEPTVLKPMAEIIGEEMSKLNHEFSQVSIFSNHNFRMGDIHNIPRSKSQCKQFAFRNTNTNNCYQRNMKNLYFKLKRIQNQDD